MKKSFHFIFLIILVFTLSSCAKSVTISRMAPAKYHISGIDTVAFTPFTYRTTYHKKGQNIIPGILEKSLKKDGFFDVEDLPVKVRLDMDEDLGLESVLQSARSEGIDAIITGMVMAYQMTSDQKEIMVEKEVETGQYRIERYEENGQVKVRKVKATEKREVSVPSMQLAAEVSFYLDIYDTASGKRLDHDYYTKIGSKKAEGEEEIRKLPSEEVMLRGVTEELANKFVLRMTPHRVTEKLYFKDEKPCKEGVKLAKKDDWAGAVAMWNAILSGDSSCTCALYNLGLAREVEKDYDGAYDFYKRAFSKDPDEKLYANAQSRTKKKKSQARKLEKQMEGREE